MHCIIGEISSAFFRETAKMHPPAAIVDSDIAAFAIEHGAGMEVAEHRHDCGQISVVFRGTLAVTSDDGWRVVPPGMAIWIPPQLTHGARYSESSSLIHLRLSNGLTSSLPGNCVSVVATDFLRALAFEALRLQRVQSQSEAINLVARLVVMQLALPQSGPKLYLPHGRDRRLQQATAILRSAPGENLTLDELAHKVHTSGRTLARLFVTETGMSFTRWRDYLKIINAIDRLARQRSITQTASELGYRSTSSFTTLFTRLVGLPPKRYMQFLHKPGS